MTIDADTSEDWLVRVANAGGASCSCPEYADAMAQANHWREIALRTRKKWGTVSRAYDVLMAAVRLTAQPDEAEQRKQTLFANLERVGACTEHRGTQPRSCSRCYDLSHLVLAAGFGEAEATRLLGDRPEKVTDAGGV